MVCYTEPCGKILFWDGLDRHFRKYLAADWMNHLSITVYHNTVNRMCPKLPVFTPSHVDWSGAPVKPQANSLEPDEVDSSWKENPAALQDQALWRRSMKKCVCEWWNSKETNLFDLSCTNVKCKPNSKSTVVAPSSCWWQHVLSSN